MNRFFNVAVTYFFNVDTGTKGVRSNTYTPQVSTGPK